MAAPHPPDSSRRTGSRARPRARAQGGGPRPGAEGVAKIPSKRRRSRRAAVEVLLLLRRRRLVGRRRGLEREDRRRDRRKQRPRSREQPIQVHAPSAPSILRSDLCKNLSRLVKRTPLNTRILKPSKLGSNSTSSSFSR
jgi:hypothetical protein